MPGSPDPARLAQLQRIARTSAGRVWAHVGSASARYHHGLEFADLVSAAWEAILLALPRHDGRPHDGYLWTCARGGALDAVRRADPLDRGDRDRRRAAGESTAVTQSLEAMLPASILDRSETPAALYDRSETEADQRTEIEARDAQRMVRAALDTLDPRDGALLWCLYAEEITQHDLAETLGISHATLSFRHRRALQRLERALVVINGRDVLQET